MCLDSLPFVTVLSNRTELSKLSYCTELSEQPKPSLTLITPILMALGTNVCVVLPGTTIPYLVFRGTTIQFC